jgi:hypothetical protein
VLSLDSTRWSELEHAYGPAADIPKMLQRLRDLPAAAGDAEPWHSLWSALAHQGDIYSASFAAVPHVVAALESSPATAHFTYLQFPAWVEICRAKNEIPVPEDLAPAYFAALSRLPSLVAAASLREWDEDFLACALSAIAVAKNQPAVAEASLELSAEVAAEFLEWFSRR